MKIFIDTSAFFASLVRNDYMHVRAKATMARLVNEGAEMHATSYIWLETIALLHSRAGFDAARGFDEKLRPLVKIAWIDEPMHERAIRRLELKATHKVSLVDCASFVLMEETGIRNVFCYDDHFAKEGFVAVGTPADLR